MERQPFKKRNLIGKLLLKIKARSEYKIYKWELKNYSFEQYTKFHIGSKRVDSIKGIEEILSSNDNNLNVCHSGNAGDIIYSLPTVKRIYELTGAKINYHLLVGKPLLYGYLPHPIGNVTLNQAMAENLIPLISAQNYVASCKVYTKESIHIDLDYFRSNAVPIEKSNIARWCGYFTGVSPELWKPWIYAEPNFSFSDTIVIARSNRYRNASINYSFLKEYKNISFVGIESEFKEMRQILPTLEWIRTDNFLQLAGIIAGCKLFIGNQSFPYSIAESLKVPRILESSYHLQNVIPEGENGNDFFFQKHFEWLVEYYNKPHDNKI